MLVAIRSNWDMTVTMLSAGWEVCVASAVFLIWRSQGFMIFNVPVPANPKLENYNATVTIVFLL